jgi:hypothetical protein
VARIIYRDDEFLIGRRKLVAQPPARVARPDVKMLAFRIDQFGCQCPSSGFLRQRAE